MGREHAAAAAISSDGEIKQENDRVREREGRTVRERETQTERARRYSVVGIAGEGRERCDR